MNVTGVMLGITYTAPTTASVRLAIAAVLSAGLLLVVLAHLICGDRSGAQTEPQSPWDRPREWQWSWFAVLIINLPIPLIFGCAATTGAGTFGMLAGLVVVWLIGHRGVAHLREVRGPLMVGGAVVALSQAFPIAHICAGMLALEAVAGRGYGRVASAGDGFAVTVFTAGLLAVAALLIGFVLRAVIWVFNALEGRIVRNQPARG